MHVVLHEIVKKEPYSTSTNPPCIESTHSLVSQIWHVQVQVRPHVEFYWLKDSKRLSRMTGFDKFSSHSTSLWLILVTTKVSDGGITTQARQREWCSTYAHTIVWNRAYSAPPTHDVSHLTSHTTSLVKSSYLTTEAWFDSYDGTIRVLSTEIPYIVQFPKLRKEPS